MKKVIHLAVLIAFSVHAFPTRSDAEMTLKEAIQLAWKNHPTVEADRNRETAKEKDITRAQANYYPRVNAMALVTKGFPGSAGATGIGGLMVSPYHKGPSAGFLLEQEIYDFGRTSGQVEVAKRQTSVAKMESKVNQIQIGTEVAKIYYQCALHRSLANFYRGLVEQSKLVESEVKKFVQNGQRTVVEQYLSQSQTEEAVTFEATYQKKLSFDEKELGAILYGSETPVQCPALEQSTLATATTPADLSVDLSPVLARAKAQAAVSEAEITHARSNYLPRIVGVASLGYLDDTELGFEKNNYSVAVGLIIPLFEGFKTNAEVDGALARHMQHEKEVEATKLALNERNMEFDKEIEAAQLRIAHLRSEVSLAEKAFSLAKNRYLSSKGSLVDLRESIRNVERAQRELDGAQSDYLENAVEKALLNGRLFADATL